MSNSTHYNMNLSATDYYPFGMEMPGRTFSSNNYTFGYNGQVKDNEVNGEGNSYAYKYRMYDSRISRFFSIDPLSAKFPYNSPYAFAENRVIDGRELEGLEVLLIGVGATGNVVVGGGLEGGILIAPNGVYAYGTKSVGVTTNISGSACLSITYYGDMPTAQDASGIGYSCGLSGSAIVSIGSNYTYSSSGYEGLNYQVGFGFGPLPVQAQGSISETKLKSFSSIEKNAAVGLLNQAKASLSGKINSLNSQIQKISKENYNLSKENASLKEQLKNASGDNKKNLENKIDENNKKYWENYDKGVEMKKEASNLSKALESVKKTLTDYEE
jgi:RHS repeat-associated protein